MKTGREKATSRAAAFGLCLALGAGAAAAGETWYAVYLGGERIGYAMANIKGGERVSAAAAFLHPVAKRPNLTVAIDSPATSLLFEGDKVVGVGAKFDAVSAVGTVTAVNPSLIPAKITVDASLSPMPAPGDYLTFADYDSGTAAQKAGTAANLANASEKLGVAQDPADRYTGI